MNFLHLRYAIEVEKARSISKASEKMYTSQPNLSRAIKELEESVGIVIFKRTPNGMTPTAAGTEFLAYARNILAEVDKIKTLNKMESGSKRRFSFSGPRASYIALAFSVFARSMNVGAEEDIFYRETSAKRTVNLVADGEYSLGVLRFPIVFEKHFSALVRDYGLKSKEILRFNSVAVLSAGNALAKKETLTAADLADYIEITQDDAHLPTIPIADIRKEEKESLGGKRIYVYERASRFDLLHALPNAFIWDSPMPAEVLKERRLAEKRCEAYARPHKDVLVWKRGYTFSALDEEFLGELEGVISRLKTY